MTALQLAVNTAAAYRLTRLAQEDSLPPMPAVREYMAQRQLKDPDDLLAEMYGCPWCLGFWVSLAVVLADMFVPRVWRPLAAALALSAAVGHMRTRLDN